MSEIVKVVSAALRDQNGNIVTGVQYYDQIFTDQIANSKVFTEPSEQGFVLSNGLFVSKEDAVSIARSSGQITVEDITTKQVLYPEDIY